MAAAPQTSRPSPTSAPPSLLPPAMPPSSWTPSLPPPSPRRVRLTAALTLLAALASMAALALPWAGYRGAGGAVTWSGLDVMDRPRWVADSLDNAVDGMRVVLIVGGLLAVLSLARVLAPGARLAGLSLFLAAALSVASGVSVMEFRKSLSDAGVFAPSMRMGAPFMVVTALLCLGAAARGRAAQRSPAPRAG